MAVITEEGRLTTVSLLTRALRRPEVGAAVAAVAVFVFFSAVTDSFLTAGTR